MIRCTYEHVEIFQNPHLGRNKFILGWWKVLVEHRHTPKWNWKCMVCACAPIRCLFNDWNTYACSTVQSIIKMKILCAHFFFLTLDALRAFPCSFQSPNCCYTLHSFEIQNGDSIVTGELLGLVSLDYIITSNENYSKRNWHIYCCDLIGLHIGCWLGEDKLLLFFFWISILFKIDWTDWEIILLPRHSLDFRFHHIDV